MKKRNLLVTLLSLILTFSVSIGLTTATTIVNAEETPVEYSMGDANLDGNVNTRDVVLIKQAIVGLAELNDKQKVFADVYADGTINTRDVVLIQQYIVGMDANLGEHEHVFDREIEDELYFAENPSCEHGTLYYKSCICGIEGSEIFEVGQALDHNYGETWETNESQHWNECVCGDKEDLADHAFEWVTDKQPTEDETGLKHKKCIICLLEIDFGTEIPKTDHSHSYIVQAIALEHLSAEATCSSPAEYYFSCACGENGTETFTYGDALTHGMSNWEEVKTPSCTEKGEEERHCLRTGCNYVEINEIEKTQHDYEDVVTLPTCTLQGYTTYTCDCGDSYISDYVNALTHDMSSWEEVKAASCTEKGEEERHCLRTGCNHSETKEIEKIQHNHESVVTAPTCTAQGYTTYTCKCGDNYISDYVNALTHDMSNWVEVKAASCTEKGEEERHCLRTECNYSETKEIAKKQHVYGEEFENNENQHWHECECGEKKDLSNHNFEWIIDKPATEDETGLKHKKCVICLYQTEFNTEIPKLDHVHEYNDIQVIQPTCMNQGYTLHTCRCGDEYKDTYVNALGHAMGNYIEIDAPTCLVEGVERSDCSRCDYYETRNIEATGHNHVSVVTSPTCTAQGYTTYTCKCGDNYISDYVNALNHNLSNWEEVKAPSCTEKGEEERHCLRVGCNYSETKEVEKTNHNYNVENTKGIYLKNSVTCVNKAVYYYSCVCGEKGTATFEFGAPLGHSFTNYISNNDATCLTDGTKTAKCNRCEETDDITDIGTAKGHSYSNIWSKDENYHWHSATCEHVNEVKDKQEHNWNNGVVIKPATIDEEGSKLFTCLTCGQTKEKVIPVIFTYIVNFYDGTTLLKTEKVKPTENATPPIEPEKDGFRFVGWDKTFSNVNNNLNIYAQYVQAFIVTFVDYDNSILDIQTVDAGQKAKLPSEPTRKNYKFTGWDYNLNNTINQDLTIKAQYIRQYTVKFVDFDGRELKTEIVDLGANATSPTNPTRKGYTFTGWNIAYSNVQSDLVITATYEINSYTVKFVMPDNSEINEQDVEYGFDASLPVVPEYYFDWNTMKAYSFTKWDKNYTDVTSNLTIRAEYTTPYSIPVLAIEFASNNKVDFKLCMPDGYKVYALSFSVKYDKLAIAEDERVIINYSSLLANGAQCEFNDKIHTLSFVWGDTTQDSNELYGEILTNGYTNFLSIEFYIDTEAVNSNTVVIDAIDGVIIGTIEADTYRVTPIIIYR